MRYLLVPLSCFIVLRWWWWTQLSQADRQVVMRLSFSSVGYRQLLELLCSFDHQTKFEQRYAVVKPAHVMTRSDP
jgi:hypothetical protein